MLVKSLLICSTKSEINRSYKNSYLTFCWNWEVSFSHILLLPKLKKTYCSFLKKTLIHNTVKQLQNCVHFCIFTILCFLFMVLYVMFYANNALI